MPLEYKKSSAFFEEACKESFWAAKALKKAINVNLL